MSTQPPWQPPKSDREGLPSYSPYPLSPEEDEIDLMEIARELWKGRFLIVAITSCALIFSVVYALWQAPQYKAEVLLSPVASRETQSTGAQLAAQYGGLASVMGIDLGGRGTGSVDAYLAILKSRKFIQHFIEEQNLLPVLFESEWDAKHTRWRGDIPSASEAYRAFYPSMKVSKDVKTGLVTLTLYSGEPKRAALWANQLVKSLNNHIREGGREEASKSIQYLEQQIKKTSWVEVREILYRLMEKEIQSLTLTDAREEFAFSIIDPAVVPDGRESPKRRQMVMLGGVIGFVASIFVVFLLHFIKKHIPPQKLEAFDFTKGLKQRFRKKEVVMP